MHFHAWRDSDGNILFREGPSDEPQRIGTEERELVHLYSVEAATWEEASAIHYLRMGWAPYRPVGEPTPCEQCDAIVYPAGTGVCWRCGQRAARPA